MDGEGRPCEMTLEGLPPSAPDSVPPGLAIRVKLSEEEVPALPSFPKFMALPLPQEQCLCF